MTRLCPVFGVPEGDGPNSRDSALGHVEPYRPDDLTDQGRKAMAASLELDPHYADHQQP